MLGLSRDMHHLSASVPNALLTFSLIDANVFYITFNISNGLVKWMGGHLFILVGQHSALKTIQQVICHCCLVGSTPA